MLIIFSGLPATGKTSIAKKLAGKIKAVFLRIDSLEQALVVSGLVKTTNEIAGAGYMVAYALAADNLNLGLTVIADSVNPFSLTRDAWRDVALQNNKSYLEIEIICSDKSEHRKRVESREADISGFRLPTWEEVINRDYQPWNRKRLVIDTAALSTEGAVELILKHLQS